jgi:hypothetical protein
MRKLTKEEIEKINSDKSYDNWKQGIFKQPYGIPVKIKESVIYSRYETGGVSGGSCWGSSDPQPWYSSQTPKDHLKVLDLVLKILKPDITLLEYRMITGLFYNNTETEYEYYGNSTDWYIEYLPLSDLYEALSKINNEKIQSTDR